MKTETDFPPTQPQLTLLKKFRIVPHKMMTRCGARRLLMFIINGNGNPKFSKTRGRIAYYRKMQEKFGDHQARDIYSKEQYQILFFLPYTKEELQQGELKGVLYAKVRAPNGGVMDFHFTTIRLAK